MDLIDLFWHLAGFVAPALWLATGVVAVSRLLARRGAGARPSLAAHWLSHAAVGLALLMLGLALTGQDGRMLTYAALVLGCGATESWLCRRR